MRDGERNLHAHPIDHENNDTFRYKQLIVLFVAVTYKSLECFLWLYCTCGRMNISSNANEQKNFFPVLWKSLTNNLKLLKLPELIPGSPFAPELT